MRSVSLILSCDEIIADHDGLCTNRTVNGEDFKYYNERISLKTNYMRANYPAFYILADACTELQSSIVPSSSPVDILNGTFKISFSLSLEILRIQARKSIMFIRDKYYCWNLR